MADRRENNKQNKHEQRRNVSAVSARLETTEVATREHKFDVVI